MKLKYLLIILLIISCDNKPKTNPVYWNFKTDLQEENLFGKVKKIEVYSTSNTGKSVLHSITRYSKFGNLQNFVIYNENGKSIYSVTNYNQNNKLIQKKSEVIKMLKKIEYDTLKKFKLKLIRINDTLNSEVISNYNDKGKVIKEIEISKTDTIFRNYKYEYNEQGKIIFENEFEIGKDHKENLLKKYEFDTIGNIIKIQFKNRFFNKVKEITYSIDNKITEIKQYYITPDKRKELDIIIKFDDSFNRKIETIYKNGKLDSEIQYEYKYDKNGNWYKKILHFKNTISFTTVETRKIKYWH